MYELSRVRLHAVGPKAARYQDVTLDLRTDDSGQPSPATVLFLENGGGKTVLVRLIFSVILPGRRQVVGTTSSKVLEKFVLASDVAHVAVEWKDTRTGQLLVTGKASEWRGHVVSADSSRLTERWYTFRPGESLSLDTLPFTENGRIVSLSGFHERIEEAEKAVPARQVRWFERQGEWTTHLAGLWLDPELFSYQRKMNAGEGEAADAFTFKTDEAFVDWLLTAIIPDEEPKSFGEVVTGYAAQLASRGELMAERDFVQGALDRLKPLAEAEAERQAAVSLRRDAMKDAERLVSALAAREREESGRHGILADRASHSQEEERRLETEVRRLNFAVNELNRLVAKLRWEEALKELEELTARRDEAKRLLDGWRATRVLVEYEAAHEAAETVREILRAQETEAEPLLTARDTAARKLARGLLAVAASADTAAGDAEGRANALVKVIEQVKNEQESLIRESAEAGAKAEHAAGDIVGIQAAIREAAESGLLDRVEDVAEAADAAEESAAAAERSVTDTLAEADEIAGQRDQKEADLEAARTDHDRKSRVAEKLGERHDAAEDRARQLRETNRLIDLLGSEEIELDSDVPGLIDLLGEAIEQAGEEKDRLQVVASAEERVLQALGNGGLLPPSEHIEAALNALAGESITAWSGWEYLSRIRADERDEVLARYPHLVDGIVLNSGDDLGHANDTLTAARLLPQTVIAVGTSATFMSPDAEGPAGIGFIVPPNPAMYDAERAEHERREIQERQQSRHEHLRQLATDIGQDTATRSRLTDWRRDFPPGALATLTDDYRRASEEEKDARETVRKLRDEHGKLIADEKRLRQSVPGLRRSSEAARKRAGSLRELAKDHARISVLKETVHAAEEDKKRADGEAARKGTRAGELEREQREAYREADSQRRTASDRRDELRHIVGGGSVDEGVSVPSESLEALRAAYRTAVDAYEKVEVSANLRAEVERKSTVESQARAAKEELSPEARDRAAALLLMPEGSDASARAEATARGQREVNALEDRVNSASVNVGELKQAFQAYEARQRSLEPYGAPRDIPHGEELIRRAQADWDTARGNFEDQQTTTGNLIRDRDAARRSAEEFGAVRDSLLAIVDPGPDEEASPFAGTVDGARNHRDRARETMGEANRLLETATEQVRRKADLLAQHATDERFEKLNTPVRRQIGATDRERLPEFAAEWEGALKPRIRVLTDELEQIERHRAAIIERLQGMTKHALGRLKAAQRASKLPSGLGDWSGLEFLRISFASPDDEILAERLGQVIDDVALASVGKDSGKRDGLSILLSAVRASLRPRGVRVEILKPDAVLRDERVRVAEIGDVFSGGQLLTAAIILYCTMAWLRAGERGQTQRPHAGVLFLDNPIGRASAGYLLELQMNVAKKLGVQLVYTTGLVDLNALSVFPLIIRLRNDADLRAGMKYLRVDERIRSQLPDSPSDDSGVLTVSRLFARTDSGTL